MSEVKETYDVAIVGGGLAGGAAAFHLAKSGQRVAVLEREKTTQHKVCGEFVSGECEPLLREIGVRMAELGAVKITKFRLHGPHQTFSAHLPLAAWGLSRKRLDTELLKRVSEVGAEVHMGVSVRSVDLPSTDQHVFKVLAETQEHLAHRVVIATGKHEFKSVQKREGRDSGYVGFKMHLRLTSEAKISLGASCDLFVFEHGYGGLSPIEEGRANFCFLLKKSELRRIGTTWANLSDYISTQNKMAASYLNGAEPLFPQCLTVAPVPYGFIRKADPTRGLMCVGDQMAVIPSLTGDGMTIAVMTGKLAALSTVGRVTEGAQPFESLESGRQLLSQQVQVGYLIHWLFKSPRRVDLVIRLMKHFPILYRAVFRLTRCRVASSSSPPDSGLMGQAQVES